MLPVYLAPLLIGITSGLTICSLSCLPYLGPYVIGTQKGFGQGVKAVLTFNLGKLISYTVLGLLAGYLGSVFSGNWAHSLTTLSALMTIYLGGSLLFKTQGKCPKAHNFQSLGKILLWGLTIGFAPCLPLTTVLAYAASTNSALYGGLSGIFFGIGTTLSPFIILGGLMGWFSGKLNSKAPQYSSLFQMICGLVLISLGIKLLFFMV